MDQCAYCGVVPDHEGICPDARAMVSKCEKERGDKPHIEECDVAHTPLELGFYPWYPEGEEA